MRMYKTFPLVDLPNVISSSVSSFPSRCLCRAEVWLSTLVWFLSLPSVLLTVHIRGWPIVFRHPARLLGLRADLHSHLDPHPDSHNHQHQPQ